MIEEVLLVRHGETPGNRNRIVQTPDTPLSERGREQAELAARRILRDRPRGWGLQVVSSDYARAAQTAAAICAANGIESPFFEPRLRERNFGHLRGQRYDDLLRQQIDPFAPDYHPPGGEDWAMFDRRVGTAWAAILGLVASHREDPAPTLLVCVTHGLVLRRMVALYLELGNGGEAPEHWANTSMTAFASEPPHRVRLLACSEHLSAPDEQGETVSGI